MIVMKFGGTSVQGVQAIDRVAPIVLERLGCRLVVDAEMPIIVIKSPVSHSRSHNRPAFLRASVSPWWGLSR